MNITNRITSATFSACITNKEGLPKDDLPIVALVGRSNVGKSSLINSLTGRKELARTSSMPGKTLTMNFYCINDAFYIVDLPGYGYAKASKATRAKIQVMMDEFFVSCNNLRGVVQIVDIRHKPSTLDMQMHNWLRDQRRNGFMVLTKSDKLSNQQVIKMRSTISKEFRGIYTMVYSSKSLVGRDEFLDAIEKILAGYEFKVTEPKYTKPLREEETRQSFSEEKSSTDESGVKTSKTNGGNDFYSRQPREKSDKNPVARDNREHQNSTGSGNGRRNKHPDSRPQKERFENKGQRDGKDRNRGNGNNNRFKQPRQIAKSRQ